MSQIHLSGSQWENIVGYARAKRIGQHIEVAGTTASDGTNIVGENDAYEQTNYILKRIIAAVEALGGEKKDIIRTRIYVTEISNWKEVGKAHGEFFDDVMPATTMVEVSALIEPPLLVEIEATAIVSS
ncbi:MAG: RidA family protein [Saprospiraceae bacterium]|nr:RidA family protein [Saprospiraceae bacterium]